MIQLVKMALKGLTPRYMIQVWLNQDSYTTVYMIQLVKMALTYKTSVA